MMRHQEGSKNKLLLRFANKLFLKGVVFALFISFTKEANYFKKVLPKSMKLFLKV